MLFLTQFIFGVQKCHIRWRVHYILYNAGCGTRLATAGYAVYGIDYEGHGKSRGARCYIKKFDNIVNDCNNFFKSVCGNVIPIPFSPFENYNQID